MLFFIIGKKISYSLSPVIYKFLLERSNCIYKKISSKKKFFFIKIILFFKNSKYINITIPYKEKIFKICNFSSKDSNFSKSCNLLIKKNNSLFSYNTDGIGFYKTIKKIKYYDEVIIFGAGGVVKGIIKYIKKKIFIINRTEKKLIIINKIKKTNIYKKKKLFKKFIINSIPNKYFYFFLKKKKIKIKKSFIYNLSYKNFSFKSSLDGLNMLYEQAKENIKIIKYEKKRKKIIQKINKIS
ncbi:hypothetical protein [Candidatus Vidania fulgoroideorum]